MTLISTPPGHPLGLFVGPISLQKWLFQPHLIQGATWREAIYRLSLLGRHDHLLAVLSSFSPLSEQSHPPWDCLVARTRSAGTLVDGQMSNHTARLTLSNPAPDGYRGPRLACGTGQSGFNRRFRGHPASKHGTRGCFLERRPERELVSLDDAQPEEVGERVT